MRAMLVTLLLLIPAASRVATLFDALGGHDGLVQLVEGMVDRATADPRIKGSFAETNVPRLKKLLVEHLCQITDGGCAYKGRDMHAAHEALKLRSRDFNALTEDLQDAMDAQGIGTAVQNRLLARLAPMHRDVVSR